MEKVDSLRDLVLETIPRQFFERLVSRQGSVYAEAREMAFKTPTWDKPEAESVYPINRRALLESEFRRSARDLELPYSDLKHKGENYWYVLLRVGKLWLTAHHVDRPRRFVRPCRSRKQNAAVNQFLDLPFFDDLLQENLAKLGDADRVNAYLLHGIRVERRAEQEFTSMFMRLAFPDADLTRYVRIYDVLDLLQFYGQGGAPSSELPSGGAGTPPDVAFPSIKSPEEIQEAEKREEAEKIQPRKFEEPR